MVRTIVKRAIFFVLAITGLVLFLAVFLTVFVSVPYGQRYLKGIIQDQASRALEQDVRIGSIKIDILSRIQVRDVSISRVLAKETIPFLTIGRASVRFNIFPLLHRKILISSITIRDMQVNVVTDSTGKTNIPLLGKKPSGKHPHRHPSGSRFNGSSFPILFFGIVTGTYRWMSR